jgi:dipeptidyl-peptidase-4
LPVIQIKFSVIFYADYYLQYITKELIKLFDFQVQSRLSLQWKKIAYAKENNLYVYDLAAKSTTQITTDGKKNAIINGIGLGL